MRRGKRTVCFCNIRHVGIGMDLVEVDFIALRGSLDRFIAGVPVCRADLLWWI